LVLGRHCKLGTTASTEAIRCFLLLHQLVGVAALDRHPQLVVLVVAAVKVLLAQTELLVRATRVATVALMVVVVVVVLVLLA
jgi:amino acid permease